MLGLVQGRRLNFATRSDIRLCLLTTLIWLVSMAIAGLRDLWTLVLLSVLAAAAFLVGAIACNAPHREHWIVRIDGAAAGAMLYTALVLMAPEVVTEHAVPGIAGLLLGIAAGTFLYMTGAHNGAGRTTLTALTLHSLFDGVLLGAVYALMPPFGISIGIAILAHKAPTGYALARRLALARRSIILTSIPAMATGLGALFTAIMEPLFFPAGFLFGMGTGLLLFVATVFATTNAASHRRGPGGWIAFGTGALAIAVVALLAPQGI